MEEGSVTRRGRPWPAWVLEGLFIVVSVFLGFGVAQFGDYRSDGELAARALAGLLAELEHNASVLKPLVPIHRAWVEALASPPEPVTGEAGIDVWFATRPAMPPGAPSSFAFLRRSAWDAALSGGALRLIDYDVASALSEIYRVQEITEANVDRLAQGALSSTATYDPAMRNASVRLLWLTLADIESAESLLVDLYRERLPVIRDAGGEAVLR